MWMKPIYRIRVFFCRFLWFRQFFSSIFHFSIGSYVTRSVTNLSDSVETSFLLANVISMFCFPSFNPDPTIQYTFWTLSIGGALTAMPVWTVSQTAVQRYMSVKMVCLARRWDSADVYHTAVITQEWWVKIPNSLKLRLKFATVFSL